MPKTEAPMAVPILAEVLKPVGYGGDGLLEALSAGVGSVLEEEAVAVAVDDWNSDEEEDDDDEVGGGKVEGTVG